MAVAISFMDTILASVVVVSFFILRKTTMMFVNMDWFYQVDDMDSKLTERYGQSLIEIGLKSEINAEIMVDDNNCKMINFEDFTADVTLLGVQAEGSVREGKLIFYYESPVNCEHVIHDSEMLTRFSTRIFGYFRTLRYPNLKPLKTTYGYEEDNLSSSSKKDIYAVFQNVNQSHFKDMPIVKFNVDCIANSPTFEEYEINIISSDEISATLTPIFQTEQSELLCINQNNSDKDSQTHRLLFKRNDSQKPMDLSFDIEICFKGEYSQGLMSSYLSGQGIWQKDFVLSDSIYSVKTTLLDVNDSEKN
jgi:hypothetical protein